MRGVIVFVKNPELGKVKTRLAATVGNEQALIIYKKLLDYTRNVLLQLNDTERHVYYSSFVDLADEWSNDHFKKFAQKGDGLGERMTAAFQETLETCSKVVIIGSDCAQLTEDHIERAFDMLDSNDLVIGPSHDGGYYLLGMHTYHPYLFEDIVWSSETVLEDTLNIASFNKLKVAQLEALSDIDNEEDWNLYGF